MTDAAHAEMFAALCKEVGFCLHPKGEKRVLEALPNGLDAATRAGVRSIGVAWGNTDRNALAALAATHIADRPADLVTLLTAK